MHTPIDTPSGLQTEWCENILLDAPLEEDVVNRENRTTARKVFLQGTWSVLLIT